MKEGVTWDDGSQSIEDTLDLVNLDAPYDR
jgi:hypothetical protein